MELRLEAVQSTITSTSDIFRNKWFKFVTILLQTAQHTNAHFYSVGILRTAMDHHNNHKIIPLRKYLGPAAYDRLQWYTCEFAFVYVGLSPADANKLESNTWMMLLNFCFAESGNFNQTNMTWVIYVARAFFVSELVLSGSCREYRILTSILRPHL